MGVFRLETRDLWLSSHVLLCFQSLSLLFLFLESLEMAGWSADATRALVAIWSQENVQSQLDGVSRNKTIFERISRELSAKGYQKSWQQCRTKIKNLTQKYRKVREWCVSF